MFKNLQQFFASPGNKYLTFLPIFVLSAHDYFKIHNLKRLKIKNSKLKLKRNGFKTLLCSDKKGSSVFKWLQAAEVDYAKYKQQGDRH